MDLAVKTSREILHGILRFANERGHWSIRFPDCSTDEDYLNALQSQTFQGFIGRVGSAKIRHQLMRAHLPAISLDEEPLDGLIACENDSIAQAASRFFIERGHRTFAYVGTRELTVWSHERQLKFTAELAKAGHRADVFGHAGATESEDRLHLADWLARLPPHTAVFVANDIRALQVVDACQTLGRVIPWDISILSCDNDRLLCETSDPALSSIQMSTEESGYEAAQALDSLMRSKRSCGKIRIPYRFKVIVERLSTATVLTGSDTLVEKALSYLRMNIANSFTTDDLAQKLNVSRRTLEQRFRAQTGQSLHKTLMRLRIEAACVALRTSSRTVDDIATSCGFASASHFTHIFQQIQGLSPSACRSHFTD